MTYPETRHMFPVGFASDHHLSAQHYSGTWSATQPQQLSVRQYPSTSSAFSASAHPDEDWTKVSDLAERRRIQNRIAQRNYRKKIKERMADLERMAGGREGVKGNSNGKKLPKIKKPTRRHTTPPPEATTDSFQAPQQHGVPPFTPPMNPEDQPFFPSPSPPAPSSPAYSTYQQAYSPPQSDSGLLMPLFGSSQPQPTSASYQFGMVSTAAVPTLPPMTHFSDAYKGGNESMSSFPSYGDYSLGVNPSHYDSNPHMPSLSNSFDYSEGTSEADWSAYPVTPLSMTSP